jgi:hypothetical protein
MMQGRGQLNGWWEDCGYFEMLGSVVKGGKGKIRGGFGSQTAHVRLTCHS